jgi:hypothetical protein
MGCIVECPKKETGFRKQRGGSKTHSIQGNDALVPRSIGKFPLTGFPLLYVFSKIGQILGQLT